MTKEYNPLEHSVVQACGLSGGIRRYEVSDFVEALVFAIERELERVYSNWNQKLFEEHDWQFIEIEGFAWRRFYWGDNEKEMDLPNLTFGEVQICWYKYPGRGMSTNVDYDERQWREWFDEVMKTVRLYDSCCQLRHQKFRDEDAGLEPFTAGEHRVQCRACKYCIAFGANSLIWNREGSRNVQDAEGK